jgi:hypothetical protein
MRRFTFLNLFPALAHLDHDLPLAERAGRVEELKALSADYDQVAPAGVDSNVPAWIDESPVPEVPPRGQMWFARQGFLYQVLMEAPDTTLLEPWMHEFLSDFSPRTSLSLTCNTCLHHANTCLLTCCARTRACRLVASDRTLVAACRGRSVFAGISPGACVGDRQCAQISWINQRPRWLVDV